MGSWENDLQMMGYPVLHLHRCQKVPGPSVLSFCAPSTAPWRSATPGCAAAMAALNLRESNVAGWKIFHLSIVDFPIET